MGLPSLGVLILGVLLAAGMAQAQSPTTVCASSAPTVGATLTGVINTYYPASASAAAGSTAISVARSTGANQALAVGDLLVVIQMQDAEIVANDDASYGDGSGSGAGSNNLNNTGHYEYVVARSTLAANTAGTITISGVGAGSGLIYSYTSGPAIATRGQSTFQVIRVPRYSTGTTVGAGLTARAWNRQLTGGVLAFDVSGILNLNGQTIDVSGKGFRGGGGLRLSGDNTNSLSATDYVNLGPGTGSPPGTAHAHASKGEGIAGTPMFVYDTSRTPAVFLDNGVYGYPNGDIARGAPGNAGGGGTDANPFANNQNTGGGGGGNCGAGGQGGFNWTPTPGDPTTILDVGGRGGAAFPSQPYRIVLGGGGGAGTTNNGTNSNNRSGVNSSGIAGGGIVLIRVGGLLGPGTIHADGANNTLTVLNDGSGAGGAGGSIVVTTPSASLSGLTATARGGFGGSNTPGATVSPHGPGGGGGGGAILLSSAATSLDVSGGSNGFTQDNGGPNIAYGATAGTTGCMSTAVPLHQIPGIKSGAECLISNSAVQIRTFTATLQRKGVLLRWQSSYESENLGFNLYREEGGRRVLITPELIAGAALHDKAMLSAGYSYAWRDPKGHAGARYWLEDVDLAGIHVPHGPAVPQPDRAAASVLSSASTTAPSALLSDLGQTDPGVPQAGQRHEYEPFGLRANPQYWQQLFLAAQPAVKLAIREQGWYRLTYADLAGLGLDVAHLDPRHLQLFAGGRERPLLVRGEQDGRFDSKDTLEFYGAGVDLPSTADNIYWLVEGPQPGRRIRVEPPRPVSSPQALSVFDTAERKDRLIYFPALRNGNNEKFFGAIVGSRVASQGLALSHLDPRAPGAARLEISLQGVTFVHHHVQVQLNGADVGTIEYDGQVKNVAQLSVPSSLLREGRNVVTLARGTDHTDVSLVDFVRLGYWRLPTADGDSLRLTTAGQRGMTVDGFSTPDVRVVDITDPNAIQELSGPVTRQGTGYAIAVRPATGPRTLLAFTDAQVKRPAALWMNHPSNWWSPLNGADIVIVAHRDFMEQVAPLKALHEKQGHQVAVVDIEDIYDEFSYGVKVPSALKDFLAHAKSGWWMGPRYVLLMGDASFDPKDYLGHGDHDFVPTKLIDTDVLESATDDWFVDFNGDDLPDLAIGRLPADTRDDAAVMVGKVLAYETSQPSGRPALLISDTNDLADFEGSTQNLRSLLPPGRPAQEILRSQADDATTRQRILDGLNAGPSLVNYAGHGSVEVWRANLLTNDDAPSLTNGDRLSVFVLMTCLNGSFQVAEVDSLSEALLKAKNGGAVAVWASSAITGPVDQQAMNQRLYQLLFGSGDLTLGEAVAKAKAAAQGDVRRTWVLLGDPLLRVR